MKRSSISLAAVAAVFALSLAPAGAAADELSDDQIESLEDEQREYQLIRTLSIGGIVTGGVLTGLGSYGIIQGLRPCDPLEDAGCTSAKTLGLTFGTMGVLFGLSGITSGTIGLVVANQRLNEIDEKLSIRLVPLQDGGAAALQWRF